MYVGALTLMCSFWGLYGIGCLDCFPWVVVPCGLWVHPEIPEDDLASFFRVDV
jgi:hypothetical protein